MPYLARFDVPLGVGKAAALAASLAVGVDECPDGLLELIDTAGELVDAGVVVHGEETTAGLDPCMNFSWLRQRPR